MSLLTNLLSRFSRHLELRRIFDTEGQPYLDRYYLAGPMPPSLAIYWGENEPTERFGWLRRTWYLHHFIQPDPDRDLHNHPGEGVSLILSGGYKEIRPDSTRWTSPGNIVRLNLTDYHRIGTLSSKCPVWTLFGMGPRVQTWGFLVNGKNIPWRTYLGFETALKEIRRCRFAQKVAIDSGIQSDIDAAEYNLTAAVTVAVGLGAPLCEINQAKT